MAEKNGMEMFRLEILGVMLVFGLIATGCTSFSKSTPYITVNISPEYTILGEATGEASDTILLGILPISVLSSDKAKYGWMSYWQLNGIKPFSAWTMDLSNVWYASTTQAVYDALQKMPEADYILAPVFEVDIDDKFFLQNIKVKVRGTAIKFKRE